MCPSRRIEGAEAKSMGHHGAGDHRQHCPQKIGQQPPADQQGDEQHARRRPRIEPEETATHVCRVDEQQDRKDDLRDAAGDFGIERRRQRTPHGETNRQARQDQDHRSSETPPL
jgi:hypothetical protein